MIGLFLTNSFDGSENGLEGVERLIYEIFTDDLSIPISLVPVFCHEKHPMEPEDAISSDDDDVLDMDVDVDEDLDFSVSLLGDFTDSRLPIHRKLPPDVPFLTCWSEHSDDAAIMIWSRDKAPVKDDDDDDDDAGGAASNGGEAAGKRAKAKVNLSAMGAAGAAGAAPALLAAARKKRKEELGCIDRLYLRGAMIIGPLPKSYDDCVTYEGEEEDVDGDDGEVEITGDARGKFVLQTGPVPVATASANASASAGNSARKRARGDAPTNANAGVVDGDDDDDDDVEEEDEEEVDMEDGDSHPEDEDDGEALPPRRAAKKSSEPIEIDVTADDSADDQHDGAERRTKRRTDGMPRNAPVQGAASSGAGDHEVIELW